MKPNAGLDPLISYCPRCWAEPGQPCKPTSGTHRARLKSAEALRNYEHISTDKRPVKAPACQCTNHMGTAKQGHKTKWDALMWAVRRPQVRGMRLEPYRCPTSPVWHVRTAKAVTV